MTTVPYLARRVAITRVREALDYEVTREGLAYMALVLVIGVAALNTGNNLLFIIVSAMLAAINQNFPESLRRPCCNAWRWRSHFPNMFSPTMP